MGGSRDPVTTVGFTRRVRQRPGLAPDWGLGPGRVLGEDTESKKWESEKGGSFPLHFTAEAPGQRDELKLSPAGGRAWSEARRPRPASAPVHSPRPSLTEVRAEPRRWGRSPAGRLGPFSPARPAGAWPRSAAHRAGGRRRPQVREAVELPLWPRKSSGQIAHAVQPELQLSDVSASSSMSSASMPPRACAGGCSGGARAPGAGCGPEGPPGAPGGMLARPGYSVATGCRCALPAAGSAGREGLEGGRRPEGPVSDGPLWRRRAAGPAAATRCPGLGSSTAAASGAREGRGRARRAAASAPGCSPRRASGGQP